ncbi:GntR family transcriptional regulator [Brevundimonas variabilis]|uniref:DNA-binding GntR family transcriptional regulator n=1 Tax=Brevundimonas variabilis TaxID=74312 RepID=A0A7W9CHG3_9CAUL|nr:DNA-binding GntR family transcriptional regulator [Brevundimonas variabilis]
MTRRRDPFHMALMTLRTYARSGMFAPGSPIVIAEEARRLRLSTTPVREALAYLYGEGLIERSPSGGYLAPRLDVALIRDRFAFRLHCLEIGLALTTIIRVPPVAETTGAPDARARMDQLVRMAGNPVLAEAFQRVGCQLHVLLEPERRVFGDIDEEATSLVAALDHGDPQRILECLRTYHWRRIDAAGALVLETEAGRLGLDLRSD